MLDMNDVLARLMNGESAEDIAAELTDVLNTAIDQKRKHDAAEANAKAAKEAALRKMFEGAREFAVCVGCEDLFTGDEDIEGMITNEAIVQELTDLMKNLQSFMDLINKLDELDVDTDNVNDIALEDKTKCVKANRQDKWPKPGSASIEAKITDRDIVNEFLKCFG
jgi:hypothetical protein